MKVKRSRKTGKIFSLLSLLGLLKKKRKSPNQRDIDYSGPQSPSEIAAGHPIVGAS